MERGSTMKVTLMDLGQALIKGDIALDDVKEVGKIVADKGKTKLKSLQTYQSMKSFKDQVEAQLSERNVYSSKNMKRSVKMTRTRSVFASITNPDGSLAIEDLLTGNNEDRHHLADLPDGRQDRKRFNRRKMPDTGEVMDLLAEEAVFANVEQPWFLQSCMQQHACQRICFPAEFATRHKRQQDGDHHAEGHHDDGHGKHHGDDEHHFGLENWDQAGYTLDESEDMHWPDMMVPNRLGLVEAIHRKTSIMRFCYIRAKHDLPPGTGPKEVRNLVRQLQKCDHTNVLMLHEAYEDVDHIYLMYEHYPCVTLQSMVEHHTWTQEDIVQIFREALAATAHASSMGLLHLSWTLCHVLIPASRVKNPIMCKVFGYGLMGVLLNDTPDHICWAPECLERYHQAGVNGFLQKVEAAIRAQCDSWSLGTIVYSLVCHRPPALSEQQAQSKKWAFTLAIDDVDPEAKSLIEGLMDPMAERRLTAGKALHHEWIRRRWRPPLGAQKVFANLVDFCESTRAKRIFGRFLTRFLDSHHLLQIAQCFYSLDLRGAGVLNFKELQIAARLSGRPLAAAETVLDWLATGAPGKEKEISFWRFAESMAEEVIDGRALRHAFESLDDDGSEVVSAEELFVDLHDLDDDITMDEVIEHIANAELEMGDDDEAGGAADHAIDYNEFKQLFPVRVERMRKLKDRADFSKMGNENICKAFQDINPNVEKWLRLMEQTVLTIQDLASKAVDNRNDNAPEAAKGLRKHFAKIDDNLKHPPGPLDAKEMMAKYKSARSKLHVVEYGYKTYLQDMGILEDWHMLMVNELKSLKTALGPGGGKGAVGNVDAWKAHDAADSAALKVQDMLSRVRGLNDEYAAFTDMLGSREACMGEATLSGRGLKPRLCEQENEQADNQGNEGAPSLDDGVLQFVFHSIREFASKCGAG